MKKEERKEAGGNKQRKTRNGGKGKEGQIKKGVGGKKNKRDPSGVCTHKPSLNIYFWLHLPVMPTVKDVGLC